MSIFWPWIRPILFRQDAERVHEQVLDALERLSHHAPGRALLRLASHQSVIPSGASRNLWGLQFRSPVGLAAGFDKNGRLLRALPHLGFGFAEIGSVTPRAQPGNPKPRLSRDPARQALWNAMGFNNDGAEVVARRLSEARDAEWIPSNFPVGVNLGKNKDTANEQAHLDYWKGAAQFLGLADYLVVNVSSPNTPGLRQLQEPEGIRRIIDPILELRAQRGLKSPILLKLAPEIGSETLESILNSLEEQVDGWVLTNTLQSNSGGLSGRPLMEISRERLSESLTRTQKPVISCGGIMNAHEAQLRLKLGASLVQTYTGYIYGGPAYPAELARSL